MTKAPDSPCHSRSRLYHAALTCGAAIAGLTVVAFLLAWSWLGRVSRDAPPADSYLAICAVAKDQPADIRAWVDYHYALGIPRVYLFDNNSTIPLSSALQDHIDDGIVQYNWFAAWPTPQSPQLYAYQRCLDKFKHRHRWIVFIDIDEYLVVHNPQYKQLPDLLRNYEQYGGLVANWVLFGSSGLIERPANPNVFQTYDMCTPMDGPAEYHVKTIANTDHVESVINPHQFQYKAGSPLPVSEDGEPVESHFTELHHAKQVSIYHYAIKSRQEFAEKMARKSGSGKGKDWSFFDSVDALSFINCTDWFGRIPWPGGH